ncbi:MAG: hypothetical protein ACQEW9_06155 [Bacteroidota bacterium]
MKIVQYAFILIMIWACGEKVELQLNSPQILDLVILDSLEIKESNGFLTRPSNATLINDTLIGIESFNSQGIWVIDLRSGIEVASVLSDKENGINFRPTKTEWREYPIIYVFDGFTKKIHQFDVSTIKGSGYRHINSITLNPPENIRFKPLMLAIFFKENNKFYLEHSTNEVSFTSNQYYKLTKDLIGSYDLEGKHIKSFLKFPDELLEQQKFIYPGKIVSSSYPFQGRLMVTFPFTKEINTISLNDLSKANQKIKFPESLHFNYDIPYLEKEVDNTVGAPKNEPKPDYFGDVIQGQDGYILQSFIKKEPESIGYQTHIMKYNRLKNYWSETKNTFDFLSIGLLSGIKNDTLYFVEASMVNKDQKYIKRAVLRPVEN